MAIHQQRSTNFLGLTHQDYLAARLLLREGYLSEGAVLAATAVEKHLKAILALKKLYPKKHHLDGVVLRSIEKHHPELHGQLDHDFIKFLKRAFKLRYASTESPGFGIVINQYRSLVALDSTIAIIDKGFSIYRKGEPADTPFRAGVKSGDARILGDNVVVADLALETLVARKNKVHELKVGKDLRTLVVEYETDGVKMEGSFCKKTNISYGTSQWQLTKG